MNQNHCYYLILQKFKMARTLIISNSLYLLPVFPKIPLPSQKIELHTGQARKKNKQGMDHETIQEIKLHTY